MFGWKKSRMKRHWSVLGLFGVVCLAAVSGILVYAEGRKEIMQSVVNDNDLYLYLDGLEGEDRVAGQIARSEARVVEIEEFPEIHTIMLLDNSLSITEQNQKKVKEILSDYIQDKDGSEQISIAVYGEDIEYLTERETDTDKLMETMDGISYENQDSYLSDILYDEIIRLEKDQGYTRFIVAADGVDNKAIGYTKEELQELLKKKNYPIYALGCVYKDNAAELENFFSIARMTKGSYFLLDEYGDVSEIAVALKENISRVTLEIPDECRDGGDKSILLTVETKDGPVELTERMSMPFQIKQEPEPTAAEPEPTAAEPEPTAEQEPIVEPEAMEQELEKDDGGMDPVTVGAAVLLVCAVAALVALQVVKKNKGKEKAGGKKQKREEIAAPPVADLGETMTMPEEEHTMFLPQSGGNFILVLRDKKDPDKVFRYPLMGRVVIGRKNEAGVNIVLNYDGSVSGRHCEITVSREHFYVEDLNSSNHTYLNGERVEGKMEFRPGSSLKLGRLEMTVDIEKK